MNPSSVFWSLILGYSLIQGLVFFVILIRQSTGNRRANQILALCSLVCALLLCEEMLDLTYGYEAIPHLIFAFSPLWYVLSPLVFFYIKSYTNPTSNWKFKDLFHLLPFLFVLINNIEFYGLNAEFKLQYLHNYAEGIYTAPIHNIHFVLFLIQSGFYVIASFVLLKKSENSFSKLPANQTEHFEWLRQLLYGLGAILSLAFVNLFVANGGHFLLDYIEYFFVIWLSGFIFIIFYKSIQNPNQIFYALPKPVKIKNGIQKSNALAAEFILLKSYLEKEKPFLNPEYAIHFPAKELGWSQNHLSQIIKSNTQKNFRDFINHYRIEEAKKRLSDPENHQFTIDSIAHESGFGSLATFYRVFKKEVGITPKEFMKSE